MARLTKRFLGELGASAAQAAAALGEMAAATEYVLVTDPATLVPYRLAKVRNVTVTAAGVAAAPAGAPAAVGRDETTWTFSLPEP